MNKTDEELNLAEAMAKRHGVRMCDENGDTHGEELYCVGIDDIADIIREALVEREPVPIPDHITCPFCESDHVPDWLHDLKLDAKAIRAEALKEAEEIAKTIGGSFADEFLAATRELK